MAEIWKDIPGWEGLYQVSNMGRVKSLPRMMNGPYGKQSLQGRILSSRANSRFKHQFVHLCRDGFEEKFYVHRLVLTVFKGPCPIGLECRHLDGNATNNHLNNLVWGTSLENNHDRIRHGTDNRGERCGSAKLTETDIRTIRSMKYYRGFDAKIAKQYGVSRETIGEIRRYDTWSHLKD